MQKVKIIWDYVFNVFSNTGYKFRSMSPSNIFFNTVGSPNSFPFLMVLNFKKCIYSNKCNNTPLSVRTIRKNLLRFLSIQLETHQNYSKRNEFNRIGKVILFFNPSPKQDTSCTMLSMVILLTWRRF